MNSRHYKFYCFEPALLLQNKTFSLALSFPTYNALNKTEFLWILYLMSSILLRFSTLAGGKRNCSGPYGSPGDCYTNPFLFLFPKPWVDSSHTCADQSQLKTQQGFPRILSCLVLYPINSWPLHSLLHLLNSERPLAVPGLTLPVQQTQNSPDSEPGATVGFTLFISLSQASLSFRPNVQYLENHFFIYFVWFFFSVISSERINPVHVTYFWTEAGIVISWS